MEETTTVIEEIDPNVETAPATAVSNNFVLKWIRFENFRRFKEADISFEREGFTGITGENGAGKSSLMIGLIFALYGKFPDDVKKADLRFRGVDAKKNPTVVSVGFEHHGQTVEVVRKLTGGNSTATAEIFLDGKQVTVATGGTATDWVTNRLGMDSEGFKTAVVVPQQELTRLVTARPAERRELIEKLAGIEDMNRAVKSARSEENDLAKTVKVLPGDPDTVDALTAEIDELESSIGGDEKRLETVEARESSVREERNTINADMARHRGVLQRYAEAQNAVGSVEHQMELQRMSLENLRSSTAALREQFPQTTVPDKGDLERKVAELRDSYKSLGAQIKGFYERKSGLGSELNGATRRIQSQEAELASAEAELADTENGLGAIDVASLEDTLRKIEDQAMEDQSTVRSMRSKKSDLQESLATLRKHHDDAQCPTCNQDLKDPEALIRSFEDMGAAYDQQERDALTNIRTLEGQARSINADLGRARSLEGKVSQLRSTVERLRASVDAERASVDRLTAELSTMDDSSVQDWEARQKAVSDEGAAVSQEIQKIQKIAEGLQAIRQQEGEEAQLQENVRRLQDDLERARVALSQVGDITESQRAVDENTRKLPLVDAALQEVGAEASSLRVELSTQRTTLSFKHKELQREKDLIAQKDEQLRRLSVLASTTTLLDEFRKDRISRIAPEMSSSATEMISAMTDGAFLEVVVAEDFSTSVINASGDTFNVSELSGGERSIVALCLRIAISSLINNENSGLLWLDEALTEQDAKRRAAILNVLRGLPIQQIIMINHTHDAEDIVDKTIRIHRAEEASAVEQ